MADDYANEDLRYCAVPRRPDPVIPEGLAFDRANAIVLGRAMWANGTVIHYHFFDRDGDGGTVRFADGTTRFVTWVGEPAQQDAVRAGFETWKDLGIGLEFREVGDRSEAEVRVGFMDFDGSWSYLGRDVLNQGMNARTMNFGWDLTTTYGRTTALHEIGHTLGADNCPNRGCVMSFSDSVEGVDRKSRSFCGRCRPTIEFTLKRLRT